MPCGPASSTEPVLEGRQRPGAVWAPRERSGDRRLRDGVREGVALWGSKPERSGPRRGFRESQNRKAGVQESRVQGAAPRMPEDGALAATGGGGGGTCPQSSEHLDWVGSSQDGGQGQRRRDVGWGQHSKALPHFPPGGQTWLLTERPLSGGLSHTGLTTGRAPEAGWGVVLAPRLPHPWWAGPSIHCKEQSWGTKTWSPQSPVVSSRGLNQEDVRRVVGRRRKEADKDLLAAAMRRRWGWRGDRQSWQLRKQGTRPARRQDPAWAC